MIEALLAVFWNIQVCVNTMPQETDISRGPGESSRPGPSVCGGLLKLNVLQTSWKHPGQLSVFPEDQPQDQDMEDQD